MRTSKDKIHKTALELLKIKYRRLFNNLSHEYTDEVREINRQIFNSTQKNWTHPMIDQAIKATK